MESSTVTVSTRTSQHIFGATFGQGRASARMDSLDEIVRARSREMLEVVSLLPDSKSACLLADTGEFITRSIVQLSRLADALVYSSQIDSYNSRQLDKMEHEHDLSELEKLDQLDDTHSALKILASQLRVAAIDIDKTWNNTNNSIKTSSQGKNLPQDAGMPFITSNNNRLQTDGYQSPHESRTAPSDTSPEELESPGNRESIHEAINNLLAGLSSRGKGQHRCPYGHECRKGGVRADGIIETFERNSDFKTHLRKHEKAFKCDIPGCKNRAGFGRIDQLQRHKDTVKHGA